MNKSSAEKKARRIQETLDRMERGLYTGVSIGWVTDQIAWLWKWRLISYEEMSQLTAKTRYVISMYKPD